MKTRIFLIIFVLSVTAFAQDPNKPAKPPKGFQIVYDKFKDKTEVGFYDVGFSNPSFAAWFRHPGPVLEGDIGEFVFAFLGGRCSGYCFNDPALIFIIDGDRVVMPPLRNFLGDTAAFPIERDLLTRIAAAKLVEYQVGRYQGVLKDKNIARLKTLLDLGTKK